MATDLAEFLGAALGFNLLLGIPLFPAAVLTGVATFLILGAAALRLPAARGRDRGDRRRDRVCYLLELFLARPADWHGRRSTRSCPQFDGTECVLLAVGILGATVMPHVIYLHSALTQDRIVAANDEEARRLFRFARIDVVIAMGIAGPDQRRDAGDGRGDASTERAASTSTRSRTRTDARAAARRRVERRLRARAARSGLSSSAVGTLAGQVVMQGFIRRQIPLWVRRAVTMAAGVRRDRDRRRPVAHARAQPGRALVRHPVRADPARHVHARARRDGRLVNRRVTTVAAVVVAALIIGLNVFLLVQTFLG